MKEFIIEPEKEYTFSKPGLRATDIDIKEVKLGKDLTEAEERIVITDFFKLEQQRCIDSPYYFMTNYVHIKGADGEKKKLERVMSLTEEEFNGVVDGSINLFVKKRRR